MIFAGAQPVEVQLAETDPLLVERIKLVGRMRGDQDFQVAVRTTEIISAEIRLPGEKEPTCIASIYGRAWTAALKSLSEQVVSRWQVRTVLERLGQDTRFVSDQALILALNAAYPKGLGQNNNNI